MKRYIILIIIIFTTFVSCTDLDVATKSELSGDNFPETEEDFIQLSGSAYTCLANSGFTVDYWFLQELSADGMILPASGGNWYDNGKYQQLHLHTWTKDNTLVQNAWDWGFTGINTCNQILALFKTASESDAKKTAIAEITTLRAFFYFTMMDLFGGLPLVESVESDVDTRSARTETFNFIEESVLESVNYLDSVSDITTYGRPTKWMAYALLAKMYLNAEVYTGTSRYDDVVEMCDKIITEAEDNGTFNLSDSYSDEFDIDNGYAIKDFIFAASFDCVDILGQYYARYWLHPYTKFLYDLPYYPSGCLRALPDYYSLFSSDPTDDRNDVWLTGKQYYSDGSAFVWTATKKSIDNSYTGDDADAVVVYQLEYTQDVTFEDVDNFDIGDDFLAMAKGYRCNKFYPDKNSTTRNQSNDVPVFRYADVLLMKAEAMLRGASETKGQTALSLVNAVRQRSNATLFTTVDLETILDERGRELCYENWRRNDLIRFGKFESAWGLKTDNDVQKRIFPIPANEMTLNPNFEQNPGYE